MPKKYEIEVCVSERRGSRECPIGHRVGQRFRVGYVCPEGMCIWAYQMLFPMISTLMHGGELPWSEVEGEGYAMCPDPEVCLVFKMKRGRVLKSWEQRCGD